jgi:HlyD family secretion protein
MDIKQQPSATAHDVLGDLGLRKRLLAGLAAVIVLVVGAGGWAATTLISGAVIAPGFVVVESNIKRVQHPSGGVVGAINVKNGDLVRAGDVVMRLDDTQTRASLGVIVSQLIDLTGRKARLEAERDDTPAIAFPAGFESQGSEAQRIVDGERKLLTAKRQTLTAQKSQLRERIGQLQLESEGVKSQRTAKSKELGLIVEEKSRVEDMHERNLTPVTRVLAMQRDVIRVEGEYGALTAQLGRIGGQINEISMQLLTLEETQRSDAQKELREIEARIAELSERRIAAEDMLKRIDIKSPLEGVVHDLAVHTVGGVIAGGETVMMVVPSSDRLTIEARILPQDIDRVRVGQSVVLRFSAFNQRTTPELAGTLSRVAADLTREPQTGNSYFLVRVTVEDKELARLSGEKIVPGMPAEVFIGTGERTALSYLVKPMTDQIARSFRER